MNYLIDEETLSRLLYSKYVLSAVRRQWITLNEELQCINYWEDTHECTIAEKVKEDLKKFKQIKEK